MNPSNPSQIRFLAFLPRIEAHANHSFLYIRCPAKRADHIAETVALAWKWHLMLEARGKDASQFVSAIATFAVRAVKSGRRVAGMEKSKDAMNPICQRRREFHVGPLPDIVANPLADALADNTATPPPDAAAFRIDFPRWLRSLSGRDRRLAQQLMVGEGTGAMARRFQISPARVSQKRREMCQDWARFHGEVQTTACAGN